MPEGQKEGGSGFSAGYGHMGGQYRPETLDFS
jgi:hypothetical protein